MPIGKNAAEVISSGRKLPTAQNTIHPRVARDTQRALTEDLTTHSDEQSGEEYTSGAER